MDIEAAVKRNQTFQATRKLDALLGRVYAMAVLPQEEDTRSGDLEAVLSGMRASCADLTSRTTTGRHQCTEKYEAAIAHSDGNMQAMLDERIGKARVAADQRIEDADRRFADLARSLLQPASQGGDTAGTGADEGEGGEAGAEAAGGAGIGEVGGAAPEGVAAAAEEGEAAPDQ